MSKEGSNVRRRQDLKFTTRSPTRIWEEQPSYHNPYLAESCRCHGYDIMELAGKRSFVEIMFLLFHGDLPSDSQAALLETLMVGLINPGPRHPATRAVMNAGVGRTKSAHLLPIALSVLGGSHLGAEEVIASMHFLQEQQLSSPEKIASSLLKADRSREGDCHVAPGFGSCYGGIDPMPQKLIRLLSAMPGSGSFIRWGEEFAKCLVPHNMAWLSTGVAAAVLCDLGFSPWSGAGLFQIMCAPGLLAHGMEMAEQPLTAMPFLDEEHFHIDPKAKKR